MKHNSKHLLKYNTWIQNLDIKYIFNLQLSIEFN